MFVVDLVHASAHYEEMPSYFGSPLGKGWVAGVSSNADTLLGIDPHGQLHIWDWPSKRYLYTYSSLVSKGFKFVLWLNPIRPWVVVIQDTQLVVFDYKRNESIAALDPPNLPVSPSHDEFVLEWAPDGNSFSVCQQRSQEDSGDIHVYCYNLVAQD